MAYRGLTGLFAIAALSAGSPTAAAVGSQQMWMRGGILVVAGQSGEVAVAVADPSRVEVRADGRLQVTTSEAKPREGRIPTQDELRVMGFRNVFPAVGLYAQRETELRLERDGPAVGRILDGAFVPVSLVVAGWAKIDLPWVERATTHADPADLARRTELDRNHDPFWVRLDDLGLDRHPLTPIDGKEAWIARQWQVVRLAPARDSPVFAIVSCMPGRLMETRGAGKFAAQRVDYRFEGVIVSGWVERPFSEDQFDHRCGRMVVRPSGRAGGGESEVARAAIPHEGEIRPAGFVAAATFPEQAEPSAAIAAVFRPGRTLHLPVMRALRLECVPYRLVADTRRMARGFVRVRPPTPNILRFEYTLGLQSDGLSVFGPFTTMRDGSSLTAACAHTLRFVRLSADRLEMMGTNESPLAFHPDDAEVWYLTARACKENATWSQASTACR